MPRIDAMRTRRREKTRKISAFTLVELLVAMAMSGIVGIALYSAFINQSRTYSVQEDVVDMQQNLRAGFDLMEREIRMAGFDPTNNAEAGIVSADAEKIVFTLDLTGTGGTPDGTTDDPNEYLTYSLYTSAGETRLGRKSTSNPLEYNKPVVENITALRFAYAYDKDDDGFLETDGGRTIWAIDVGGTWHDLDVNDDGLISEADDLSGDGTIPGADTGDPFNAGDIRAVRVWLLGQSAHPDRRFREDRSYVLGNIVITPDNAYRHRLFTSVIQCRNLGL